MIRDARSLTPPVRGRALFSLAVVAIVAGVTLTVLAQRGGPDPDAAVLVVEDAVASTPPSTVAPLATAAVTAPTSTTTPGALASTDDRPLSPLAALLEQPGSAIPPAIEPRAIPVELRIDDIFVDDPVRPVGLEPDGRLEVPDESEIGWYRYGSAPGHPGATVLAAHVTWNGEYGPFLSLGALDLGERITVVLDDASTRTYEVTERAMYPKTELPRERIWRTTGDETLVLITCGGDFNPDINRYRDNIVVYAVPVG